MGEKCLGEMQESFPIPRFRQAVVVKNIAEIGKGKRLMFEERMAHLDEDAIHPNHNTT